MPSRPSTFRRLFLLFAALAALSAAGCTRKNVRAAAPVAAPPAADVRPMTVAPDTDASPPLEADAEPPSFPAPSVAPPQVDLAPSGVVPPPRRPASPQSLSAESSDQDTAAHPQPPRMSPQLSASDQAASQRKIDSDSAVASHNLQSANGRQLNPTQKDLADKIRSFLDQAHDAGQNGDWTRAMNLAQKARLLSDELINSL